MRARVSAKPRPDQWASNSAFVGRRFGEIFQVEAAPAFVTRKLHAANMAVTYIRSDTPTLDVIGPFPTEDAFTIALALKNFGLQVWEDGRPYAKRVKRSGHFTINDLNRAPSCTIDQPFESVCFYLPQEALDEIADDLESARTAELRYQPGEPYHDEIIAAFSSSLLPAFERPEQANRMFLDHVTFALGAHVAQVYGGLRPGSRPHKGGLASWQEKRAKDALSASLKGEATLRDVARQCGLSVSHFSRAFKETTGVAPYRWLVLRRVDVAKSLLRARRHSLSDIALECGFADQSHFTRVFTRIAGISPGAWRRNCEIE